MSSAFLLISQTSPAPHVLEARIAAAKAYCPFEPTTTTKTLTRDSALITWSALEQAHRGIPHAQDAQRALTYDGFIVEPADAPTDLSVAQNLLGALKHTSSLFDLSSSLEGGWCAIHGTGLDTDPTFTACTDLLGQRHLYYGSRAGISVISNRAIIALRALYPPQEQLPIPNAHAMAWLLTTFAAPFKDRTPWPELRCAGPDHLLKLRHGHLQAIPRQAPPKQAADDDFGKHFSDLCAQLHQLSRHPALPWRIALTGGKDSRAVLAGAIGARALPHIKEAYLRAHPQHPDAIVGQQLAAHYNLPFVRLEPGLRAPEWSLLQRLEQHNFLTECQVHAYDLKSYHTLPPYGLLHGNFGELYKSHFKQKQRLGWPYLMRYYTSADYINPRSLLTPSAIESLRPQLGGWLQSLRDQGIKAHQINDRIHRHARMHRWVGQCQQADSALTPSINPLASPSLVRWYDHTAPLNTKRHIAHFELIRRADDWLWRQPFAGASWSKLVVPHQPASMKPVTGAPAALSSQLQDWRANSALIQEYLLDEDRRSDFSQIVDRAVLTKQLNSLKETPKTTELKAIFGLLGIKQALSAPITPRFIALDAHP